MRFSKDNLCHPSKPPTIKMTKEFNLSSKRCCDPMGVIYWEKDVKEFIKRFKEKIDKAYQYEPTNSHIKHIIDKLAGNSLSDIKQLNEEERANGK